ncbi:hypothetical protein NA57DRAFT_59415 [Rhizodiscina lignyota]|uniref:Uncharacterized protein n=1 Tax=Rhizodiscina lignyota TaxID=1504668 RepID=A0A9P4IBU4_9PEZI|nr:hypothetical protein NA57DRAFT_59415 [Rhizodiscina lignyota]
MPAVLCWRFRPTSGGSPLTIALVDGAIVDARICGFTLGTTPSQQITAIFCSKRHSCFSNPLQHRYILLISAPLDESPILQDLEAMMHMLRVDVNCAYMFPGLFSIEISSHRSNTMSSVEQHVNRCKGCLRLQPTRAKVEVSGHHAIHFRISVLNPFLISLLFLCNQSRGHKRLVIQPDDPTL